MEQSRAWRQVSSLFRSLEPRDRSRHTHNRWPGTSSDCVGFGSTSDLLPSQPHHCWYRASFGPCLCPHQHRLSAAMLSLALFWGGCLGDKEQRHDELTQTSLGDTHPPTPKRLPTEKPFIGLALRSQSPLSDAGSCFAPACSTMRICCQRSTNLSIPYDCAQGIRQKPIGLLVRDGDI